MNFSDLMDVHDAQTEVDKEILSLFWDPENNHETVADLKMALREKYLRDGKIAILNDCQNRALKSFR